MWVSAEALRRWPENQYRIGEASHLLAWSRLLQEKQNVGVWCKRWPVWWRSGVRSEEWARSCHVGPCSRRSLSFRWMLGRSEGQLCVCVFNSRRLFTRVKWHVLSVKFDEFVCHCILSEKRLHNFTYILERPVTATWMNGCKWTDTEIERWMGGWIGGW